MAELLYKFINVETIEENGRKVSTASENWVINGRLRWPPTKEVNSKRKNQTSPEDHWTVYECKVLGEPFTLLKDALKKEKTYEQFSNSESEREYLKKKDLKRKHPVPVDLIDANELFDEVREIEDTKKQSIGNPILDQILPVELLDGQYSSEETSLAIIGEAIGSTVVSNECNLQTNQLGQSIQYVTKPFEYQPQLNRTVKPSEHSVQPIQYHVIPNQYHIQQSQYPAYLNQQSFPMTHYPAQCNSYTVQSKDIPFNLNQVRDADTSKIIVLEQHTLGSNDYSRPVKSISDSNEVKNSRIQQESINKMKKAQKTKKAINNRRKENINATKSVDKSSKVKPKSKGNRSERQCLDKKKKIGKNQSNKSYKPAIEPLDEFDTNQSNPSTSAAAEYVNNFNPSPDHAMTGNLTRVDYLPLIYKELLEIKTMCKGNHIENNKKLEEVKEVCGKLASTMEEDDPFSDGSLEIFNSQFPMEKKRILKSFQQQLIVDPLMEKKVGFRFRSIGGAKPRVMIRECMKYIISDSLLRRYTWKGTRKKPGFVKMTRIWKTLYSSVNSRFRKYTESKFNIYMSEYIKQANTRHKRKLNRKNETDESDNDDSEKSEESEDSNDDEGNYESENGLDGDEDVDEDDDEDD